MIILFNATCYTSDNPLNHRSTLDSPLTLLTQNKDLSEKEKKLLKKMRYKRNKKIKKTLQAKIAAEHENNDSDDACDFDEQPLPCTSQFIPIPRPATPAPYSKPTTPVQSVRPGTPIPSSPQKVIDTATNLLIFSDQVVEAAIFRLTQIPEEDTTAIDEFAALEEISYEITAITRTTPEYSPDASWIRINYDEEMK